MIEEALIQPLVKYNLEHTVGITLSSSQGQLGSEALCKHCHGQTAVFYNPSYNYVLNPGNLVWHLFFPIDVLYSTEMGQGFLIINIRIILNQFNPEIVIPNVVNCPHQL